MGTYRQPTGAIDTSFSAFHDANVAAYDKEQAKRAALVKARRDMAAKVLKQREQKLKEEEKHLGPVNAQVKETGAAVKGYQDLRSNMGVKIFDENGEMNVTQITAENFDNKSKLIENYSIYSNLDATTSERTLKDGFIDDGQGNWEYVGDDLSTPNVIESDFELAFSQDEIDWLEDSYVRMNTQARLDKDMNIINDQHEDLNLVDWWKDYKNNYHLYHMHYLR